MIKNTQMPYNGVKNFKNMVGKTMRKIEGKIGDEKMVFWSDDKFKAVFYHEQVCCENVSINDIIGDLDDLIGSPILYAEEISSKKAKPPKNADSFLWTFYRFATVKGSVTVRWLGESNGYYSESVSYCEE